MKVVGVMRVSTKEQKEKGHGLDIQEKAIRKYCKDNNLQLVHLINEKNVSGDMHIGFTLEEKRPSFIEGILKAKELGAEAILVHKTDRLWRGYRSMVYIQDFLYEQNLLNIISITEPDYKVEDVDPNQEFFQTVIDATVVLDKRKVVSRMRSGIREKISKGEKTLGAAAFGYRFTEDKKIEIDPIEEPVVRLIKELFDNGVSYRKICDTLKQNGMTTRKGKNWTTSSLYSLLNNPFYRGYLKLDDDFIKGNHQSYWD